MKFKVGEKVRVKKDLDKIENFECGYMSKMKEMEGKIVTIKDISYERTWVSIEECPNRYNYDIRAFEKIYEKPTLKKLERMPMGTKITIDREDDNVLVKTEEDELEFYSIKQNENLDRYDINDDLTIDEDWDDETTKIIKIEKPVEYETVYEYFEEEKKEMTIAEIEKELGYSVKIVKETKE